MSTNFDPGSGLVVVTVHLWGPAGTTRARLAVDTGATVTMISPAHLVSLGYDPSGRAARARMTSGTGVQDVPMVRVERISALGWQRSGFPVIAHTLPPSATVDGVLGLDFMRGQVLTVDFRQGQVSLT